MKNTDRITKEMVVPPQTRKNKLVNYVIYAVLIILATATGLFLYWIFQSKDVLQVHNAPFPVRTIREHPTADGVVILSVDYCKKTEVTGRLRMSFVSQSREIFLPVIDEPGEPGCTKTEFPVLIPHETPADTYKVKFHVDYEINPLKTVAVEFESEPFVVDEQSNADLLE